MLAAIALFVAAQGIGAALREKYLRKYDFQSGKVDFAARERADIIVAGASHVDMGIDPAAFDDELTKRGHSLRSFNLGIGGLSVVEMAYDLRNLYERAPFRYAVLSPCFECMNVARQTDNIRSIEFFDAYNAIRFARFVHSYAHLPEPPLPSATYYRNILSAVARRYLNIGLGAAALNWSGMVVGEPDVHDPKFWDQRGVRGHASFREAMSGRNLDRYAGDLEQVERLRPERIDAVSRAQPGLPDLITDGTFAYFVEVVDYLRERGVSVVVIQPPSIWHWTTEATFVAKFRMRCPEIPLIDFGDISEFSNLFLPAEIRYDDAHLNGRGAIIWARTLAEKLSVLLDQGKLEHQHACTEPH